MDKVTTVCYRQERVWKSRRDAIEFFEEGAAFSCGSERDRYLAILLQLRAGDAVCRDKI